jgi:hypothetical protein
MAFSVAAFPAAARKKPGLFRPGSFFAVSKFEKMV